MRKQNLVRHFNYSKCFSILNEPSEIHMSIYIRVFFNVLLKQSKSMNYSLLKRINTFIKSLVENLHLQSRRQEQNSWSPRQYFTLPWLNLDLFWITSLVFLNLKVFTSGYLAFTLSNRETVIFSKPGVKNPLHIGITQHLFYVE